MRIFDRFPRQKRGSRCVVLLLPLFLVFALFLALTIVRFPSYAQSAKVTSIVLTALAGAAFAASALLLFFRTRRFYRLGKDAAFPCAAIRAEQTRKGRVYLLAFYKCTDEAKLRAFLAAEDNDPLFSEDLSLREEERERIAERYLELEDEIGKACRYREFIPFDLNFLHGKQIFCDKESFAALFGRDAAPQAPCGSKLIVYDKAEEWDRIRTAWKEGARSEKI